MVTHGSPPGGSSRRLGILRGEALGQHTRVVVRVTGRPGLSDRAVTRLLFALMTFLWGLGLVVVRLGLREGVPPFAGCAARFWIAAAVSGLLVLRRRQPLPVDRATAERYVVVALLSVVLPFGLVYLGLARVISGFAGVTAATMPLLAAILARWFLREPFTLRQFAGAMLGLVGIVVLSADSLHGGGPDPLGLAMLLGAALANAAAAVYVRARCGDLAPLSLNTASMALGAAILTILAVTLEGRRPAPTPLGWLTVVWLAVFSSVVCYAIYYWLLGRREVAGVTLTSLLFPLVTFALEPLVLRESLPAGGWFGAGIVLAGVALAMWERLRSGSAGHARSA